MWRLAISLVVLRRQLDEKYPNRNKASDGTIGDSSHQATPSDHNPNQAGVVTAIDFTHDPANLDCNRLADWLVQSLDKRIKYIIWNRRIWEGSWKPYNGENPHDKHLHLSVKSDYRLYDNNDFWEVGNDMYPNKGDLQNITDEHGWQEGPDGKTQPNAVAYWTTGTGNPHWGDPNTVWVKLIAEVANWKVANQLTGFEKLPFEVFKKK